MPFQNNTDIGIVDFNGSSNTLNFQPMVPFSITAKYSLITRYIVPVIAQYDISGMGAHEIGLSDVLVSGLFSNAVVKNGVVCGVGDDFLVPTATDDFPGTKKFGIGPAIIVLQQKNGCTYGILMNQI